LNTVVRNYNEQSNEDYIWWLYIDADEFPNIDIDISIINFLKSLDSSVRGVQGYMFDHIPTHQPYCVSGYHPVDFMQFAAKSNTTKIPLLRYDKNKQHLYSGGGAHSFDTCGEDIPIVINILDIHHFNMRRQDNTLRRLKQLTMQNSVGVRRSDWYDRREQILKKSHNAKSMYHNRYERAKLLYDENKYKILFIDELKYSYNNIVRWYNPYELKTNNDTLLSQGMHNYFLKNYDIALFKFNDLLSNVKDHKLEMLLSIKIAECISFTNKSDALSIIQPILNCLDREISEYAAKQFAKIGGSEISERELSNKIEFIIQFYYGEHVHKNFV